MDFLIADTFTAGLARLTGTEQKAVKTTAFDLQLDPAAPGMRFHRLEKAKDPGFWLVRVNADIRLIVHRSEKSLLLCYVGHHDDAYRWAERRKIERHPSTGAAQLVEIRERVEEIVAPRPEAGPAPAPRKPLLFAHVSDDDLLGYGVPAEWLADVRAATEDSLFDVSAHLPQEAAEALLDLATGVKPAVAAAAPVEADPFRHPDAQRRFRVLANAEELARALEYPWEKWTVFLHPAQRTFVERRYRGPARVAGSAGTGKTIVALHRAAHLARRHPDARVLLTTFSATLANALRAKLARLVGNEPNVAGRIAVQSVGGIADTLYAELFGAPRIATPWPSHVDWQLGSPSGRIHVFPTARHILAFDANTGRLLASIDPDHTPEAVVDGREVMLVVCRPFMAEGEEAYEVASNGSTGIEPISESGH